MATGIVKSQGQKTSFWSVARKAMGNMKKGMLNNPALNSARMKKASVQKRLTK